jgi:predicted LPLAT superfamily acyltransferase
MPWRLHQNYALDRLLLLHGRVDDGTMEFAGPELATAHGRDSAGLTAAG